jgi:hypothetical protein
VEFLLMLQPDTTDTSQRNSLLAIKLTGDSNVSRWQYGFVVPDLRDNGLIRIAGKEEFRAARVVKSAIHIAADESRFSVLSSAPQ